MPFLLVMLFLHLFCFCGCLDCLGLSLTSSCFVSSDFGLLSLNRFLQLTLFLFQTLQPKLFMMYMNKFFHFSSSFLFSSKDCFLALHFLHPLCPPDHVFLFPSQLSFVCQLLVFLLIQRLLLLLFILQEQNPLFE